MRGGAGSGEDKPVRVVVLTDRSARGVAILEALTSASIRIEAIIIDAGRRPVIREVKRAVRILRSGGIRETRLRIQRRLQRLVEALRGTRREVDFYRAFSDVVKEVPNANADECERLLRSLAPDVIVLGPSRILKPHILRIPSIGVLNPHPGLLPQYRGVDVIPWALYNGDPLGVTVHFADPGVDTGDIVAQRRIAVQPGDTLASLRRRADAILGELMVKVLSELAASRQIDRRPQDPGSGRLYRRMPHDLKEEVKAKLSEVKPT
jgi:folate-dependent phosphoribosylglycinamide formyltransferase PurN